MKSQVHYMNTKINAAITAVGGYVPETVLDNAALEKMVDTSDAWILSRTGIKERRILEEGKATSDMAALAIQNLLESSGVKPEEIEVLILATSTPDHNLAPAAPLAAQKAGLINAWGFDLNAACSGFLYALSVAASFIESGRHKKVLLVGADKMSAIVDYTDRNTCILFGDGAGAVLLEPNEDGYGILDSNLKSDGSGKNYLHMKGGGSLHPASIETVTDKSHFIYQEGQSVFKFAVRGMADVSAELLERNNLTGDDIAWLVPHQANMRIIDATANRMGLTKEKVMINIHRYGNTTAATIPLCLWDWEKQLKKDDLLVFAAFGGGFTWGASLVKWAY